MSIPAVLLAALGAAAGVAAGVAAWWASSRWIAAWSPGEGEVPSGWRIGLTAAGGIAGCAGAIRHAGDPAGFLALALCGPALLFLVATDLRVRRIPAVGAAMLAVAGLAAASFGGLAGQVNALAGAFAGVAATGALWAAGKVAARREEPAFGGGDVLLAAGVGLAVGWPLVVPVLFFGAVAAAVAAAVSVVRGGKDGALPWGAYLCCAALIALAS